VISRVNPRVPAAASRALDDARWIAPNQLVVGGPRVLTASAPYRSLAWLALLRDLAGLGIRVQWSAVVRTDWPCLLVMTLPPPIRGDPPGLIERWQTTYEPLSLLWRQGPGFALIDDCRRGKTRRWTLTSPRLLRAWRLLQDPRRLTTGLSRLAFELLEEDLVVAVGGWALAAPVRVQRWPVTVAGTLRTPTSAGLLQ